MDEHEQTNVASETEDETCAICGCRVHRDGGYAKPTVQGRSHATRHHVVAERFFGRSANRQGTIREPIFAKCPWNQEGVTVLFCYECHEELMHNPVLLREDIERFSELVRHRGWDEDEKSADRRRIAERIQLLHEVIAAGLAALLPAEKEKEADGSH